MFHLKQVALILAASLLVAVALPNPEQEPSTPSPTSTTSASTPASTTISPSTTSTTASPQKISEILPPVPSLSTGQPAALNSTPSIATSTDSKVADTTLSRETASSSTLATTTSPETLRHTEPSHQQHNGHQNHTPDTSTTAFNSSASSNTLFNNEAELKPAAVLDTNSQPQAEKMAKLKLVDGILSTIDLSHPLNDKTLHWPTNEGFQYIDYTSKANLTNYYLLSDGIHMAVHTGTHLDAPRHFSSNGWTVDQIPLERLVDVPICVVDLSLKVAANRSYSFIKDDFTNQPLIRNGSVVLVYTGISQMYEKGAAAYFGSDSRNISELTIPGFSKEAADYLVGQGIYGVGLDAPSADSSSMHKDNSLDPVAHSIFNNNNIYILENINKNLKDLAKNDVSVRLFIAPLAITGGSGSPVRLIAYTSHDHPASNSASGTRLLFSTSSVIMMISIISLTLCMLKKHSC